MNRLIRFGIMVITLAVTTGAAVHKASTKATDWTSYYGSVGNDHYSPLKQIDRSNVSHLREVWRFDTKEAGGLETTPLIINGILYTLTPSQKVIALDGRSGKLLWTFDSHISATGPNRGLSMWQQGNERRLFAGVMHRLYALDPKTGRSIESFGTHGYLDLRESLGREIATQSIALTSPGVFYRDLIIVGGRVPETLPAPPGDVRAYDVHSGKLRWSFHAIPHPGEPGYDTWPADAWMSGGSANNWAGMAIDTEHGIVYVPTGSAAPDFYGGARLGDNLYANCVLALNAETGKLIWHFQGVHHDLWDRDFPSPPTLLTVHHDGKEIPAIAESSKQGLLFVFNRLTGESLFPIEDKPVPASDIPGEKTAATQPIPTLPTPFARQEITEATLTTRTQQAHSWALEQFRKMRHISPYTPFRLEQDTLVMPSFEGGGEWGGMAVDPRSGVLFINANDYASIGGLAVHKRSSSGRSVYLNQCSQCHGDSRTGSPPAFPSLIGIDKKLSSSDIEKLIHMGRGRMPSFPNLQTTTLHNLVQYLLTGIDKEADGRGEAGLSRIETEAKKSTILAESPGASEKEVQYTMTGYRRFLDPDNYPAVSPPWGTLSAIDLNTGQYLWKRPLGEYPALAAQGLKDTGTENYGGPLVTAGGVIFIGATNFDRKFRAFDEGTGKLLWETTLPFAGNATPATYEIKGKQYVVIAAGGSSLMVAKGSLGGVYVVYALPD